MNTYVSVLRGDPFETIASSAMGRRGAITEGVIARFRVGETWGYILWPMPNG